MPVTRTTLMLLVFGLLLPGRSATAAEDAIPTVPEHEPLRLELPVRNPNDRAVLITDIDATCSCNTLELAKKFLLPFERTTVTVGMDNDNQSGERSHKIWMFPSNPRFEPIITELRWRIVPNVAVDLLPDDDMSQRPADRGYRDVYGYTVWVKPGEIATRLSLRGPDSKKIRLWSPSETAPEGGLQIEKIVYEGKIWQFTTRQFDDAWLIVAHAGEQADEVAPGTYSETAVVHTNHPDKPTIELQFHTAIDPQAGAAGGIDPWAHLR